MQVDSRSCLLRMMSAGFTSAEIANDSGVSLVTISRIKNGRSSGRRVAVKLRESLLRFEKKRRVIEKLCHGEKK